LITNGATMLIQIHREKEAVALVIVALLVVSLGIGIGFAFGQKPSVMVVQENKEIAQSQVPLQWVSQTEYVPGEEGKAVVLITDFAGAALNANCTVFVYYPNQTVYVSGVYMSPDDGIGGAGIYSYNFTVPPTLGVYQKRAFCQVMLGDKRKDVMSANSFHVSSMTRELNASLPGLVWNYGRRETNATNLGALATQDNITMLLQQTPLYVWNSSTRSLTKEDWLRHADLQTILEQLNASVIWEYPNRTLTAFPPGSMNGNISAVIVMGNNGG